jgi:hypothetical protein
MRKTFRTASIVTLAAALGLAACSSKPEAPKAALNEGAAANESENATAEAPPPAVVDNPPISEAQSKSEPVPNPNEPGSSDSAPTPQMRDDADASGMTARLPDTGDVQPAETGAEK